MTTLAEELAKADYSGLDHQAAAEKLNGDLVPWYRVLTAGELNAVAGITEGHARIQDVVDRVNVHVDHAQRSACITAWRALDRESTIDLNEPAQLAILDAVGSVDVDALGAPNTKLAEFVAAVKAFAALSVPVAHTLTDVRGDVSVAEVVRARQS